MDTLIRGRDVVNLQHLRRFTKPEHLPISLTQSITSTDPANYEDVLELAKDSIVLESTTKASCDAVSPVATRSPVVHFLICAASVLPIDIILQSLSSLPELDDTHNRLQALTIRIPLLPPTSEEQAQDWSKKYWPTVYKKNNPFGPHPSIISRTEEEIRSSVGDSMELASFAGNESSVAQRGEPVGAVIVDRTTPTGTTPVVVAGDARWHNSGQAIVGGPGNIMAHAVMRAIGLVARKRRELLVAEHHSANEPDCSDKFAEELLTDLERELYSKNALAPGGYLCLGLELYITHEPCVMCSMAILHSRFGKVVFGERLPRTGGISADLDADTGNSETREQGLGYGLFWRPELNWKLLAWQWVDDRSLAENLSDKNTHA